MKIAVPRELFPGEKRVPMVPAKIRKLVDSGAQIEVEAGLGQTIQASDKDYQEAGATIVNDRTALLNSADLILRLRKPPENEIDLMKEGSIHISLLDPFENKNLVEQIANRGISAIAMDMIPRITRAQKMDVLSSQANLAGYVAVILAAEALDRIFPMMTTPAGTIAPARVFIIGAGVAGLQAIATAKRLGARVQAFDTRPVVEEQVRSLGARFVKIDLGDTGETEGGYAKALTQEQLALQHQGMAKVCATCDIVITTAQVFGRKAPRIVTRDMIEGMKSGSVLVDLAVETGGNIEGSVLDQVVELDGVRIIGKSNLPGLVPVDASDMYSSNLTNLLSDFWDEESKEFLLDLEDEVIKGALMTHQGTISNQTYLKIIQGNT